MVLREVEQMRLPLNQVLGQEPARGDPEEMDGSEE
jgi:hypothetical protein